ncbi:MAG: outer membrane beta-barrel protein [Deltaproteobacteria bacterium]|nr:outer membrane beta-barrel protein [Deltaproteobacteria bacterium]
MKRLGGKLQGRRGYLLLLVAVLTCCLLLPGPKPVAAEVNNVFYVGVGVVGLLAAGAIGYGLYETKMRPDQPRLLDGEFYIGGYMGASFAQNQNLKYDNGAVLNNGLTTFNVPPFTLSGNRFQPGVVGGLKFGYFFKSIPYLGLEGETNVAPNRVRSQTLAASPRVFGNNPVTMTNQDWINWTSALHIVGRYGFFKDSEVPFGRLQPYVGIGPGLVVMYDQQDAAKNFAIDVMAGIRYMMLKNVSAYVEYKYNHQFDAEMETHTFIVPPNFSGGAQGGTAHLPFDLHRIVFGVAYHF